MYTAQQNDSVSSAILLPNIVIQTITAYTYLLFQYMKEIENARNLLYCSLQIVAALFFGTIFATNVTTKH